MQEKIHNGTIGLEWSFMLDFENNANPYDNQKESIAEWKQIATIDLQILADGTVTVKTGAISDAVHLSADQLLADMEKLLGGQVTKVKNPEAKHHVHAHGFAHAH